MIYEYLDWGITQIDTGFHRDEMAACYLMEDNGQVALIETGIKSTVDRILTLLADKGLSTEQVSYIIPTHVHLDHAGGVGLLMQSLPNAKLVIHPMGARHMIDPTKLQAGAIAVYGKEEFEHTYGELIPVNEDKVIIAEDEFSLTLGNRKLTFYDTPGHARHHFCVHDSLSRSIFTGDTFGLAYKELTQNNTPFIFPTTTPVQFEPQAMKASIKKLMALKPENLFLTHYGMIEASAYIAQEMLELIDAYVEIALAHQHSQSRVKDIAQAMLSYLISRKRDQGFNFDEQFCKNVLHSDALLNAQGLDIWLSRQAKA